MSSFYEFLQDYEAKENEEQEKFIKRLKEGKVSQEERYPSNKRFVNLKEPIACPTPSINVWGMIPFYGSTIVKLLPFDNKISFDEYYNKKFGFTSRNLDEIIDLAKETGKIQFVIVNPTSYKNIEFLEPFLCSLKPPSVFMPSLEVLFGDYKLWKKYQIEYETIAQLGFNSYIYEANLSAGVDINFAKQRLNTAFAYIGLKVLGYEELADELGYLMITNPSEASSYFDVIGYLIVGPKYDPLKSISCTHRTLLTKAHEIYNQYNIKDPINIPYEVGRFLLNKIVLYPETLDGCMKVIQEYEDYDLYKILYALDEGVKRENSDIVEDKKADLSEILDNVWNDADKIKTSSFGVSYGVSVSIGLVGDLATGLPGTGLLTGLGFQVIDRFWGEKNEPISEKFTKFFYPNHLVTIYDFKNKIIK